MENLDLIDWRKVGFGAMWITGLAVILSALGFADYHAHQEGVSIRDLLKCSGYQMAINGGLTLFCLGLIDTSRNWLETVLLALLAGAFAFFALWST